MEDLINDLNQELYEQHKTELTFSYSSNGMYSCIEFDGQLLWNSEDDDRQWMEEENDYEPMKPYIKKLFNEWIDSLTALKLK